VSVNTPTGRSPETGARWIGDDQIGVARFPLLDLGVHDLCAAVGEVGCGVGARGRRTLDDDHPGPLEHRGEQPDPAVRVDDGVGIGEVRARLGNRCHQQLSGGRAGLEERRRADLEIPSGDVLVDDRAGPDTDVGGHVEELDITIGHPRRAFAAGVPHPETDLSVTANLHRRQEILQARMTDGTGVELDDVVRGPTSQTESTPVDRPDEAWSGRPTAARSTRPRSPDRRSSPVRRNASVTTAAFSSSCAAGATCCQVHPPQPAAYAGHGGSTRALDGSSTSATSARAKSFFDCTTSIATDSSGSAPRTNTTRPSGIPGDRVAAGGHLLGAHHDRRHRTRL
jgi:hypothetical protein